MEKQWSRRVCQGDSKGAFCNVLRRSHLAIA
jgi:hypothetical protein